MTDNPFRSSPPATAPTFKAPSESVMELIKSDKSVQTDHPLYREYHESLAQKNANMSQLFMLVEKMDRQSKRITTLEKALSFAIDALNKAVSDDVSEFLSPEPLDRNSKERIAKDLDNA